VVGDDPFIFQAPVRLWLQPEPVYLCRLLPASSQSHTLRPARSDSYLPKGKCDPCKVVIGIFDKFFDILKNKALAFSWFKSRLLKIIVHFLSAGKSAGHMLTNLQ